MQSLPVSAVLVLAASGVSLAGQAPPPQDASNFVVSLKVVKGRLACDCEKAVFTSSAKFDSLVAKKFNRARFIQELCADIDRLFRTMPKAYYLTLEDAQKAQEDIGKLEPVPPGVAESRSYDGPLSDFPRVELLQLPFSNQIIPLLNGLSATSPLKEVRIDEDDPPAVTDPLTFAVRDPIANFHAGTITFVDNTAHPLLDAAGVTLARVLEPLDGLPANQGAIHEILDDFYVSRGYSPNIQIDLATRPVKITIVESRVSALLIPPDIKDMDELLRIFWNATPYPVFRGFRKQAAEILKRDPPAATPLRQINFSDVSTVDPLPLHSGLLQSQDTALATVGYGMSLMDLPSGGESMKGLVITAKSQADGAAAEPAATSSTALRPGGSADLHPATPLSVAGGNTADAMKLIVPEKDKRYFLGGGVDYKPGQRFRLFGTGHGRSASGNDQFSFEAGGNGSGFGTASYRRDFIALPALGRRLAVSVDGGTTFVENRLLPGGLAGERRTGAAGRVEMELFREWNGKTLTLSAEARRATVRLSPIGRDDLVTNLNTLEIAADHFWMRRATVMPSTLHLQPSLRFGDPRGTGVRSYRVFRTEGEWHQNISTRWPLEVDSRLHIGIASSGTPVFDLPSLGGTDSLRGFREDDALGRRYWALQNEVWVPLTGVIKGQTPLGTFIRKNVWLAPFADFGGVYQAVGTTSGARRGFGAGPRVRYKGAIFAFDFGYGFGDGASGRGHGRTYFSIRLP